MALSVEQWHKRYLHQSAWTTSLREFIFKQVNFKDSVSILEVGSGTGAVIGSLPKIPGHYTFGLDIQLSSLHFARANDKKIEFSCADANCMPFASQTFDITFCHYLLLWLKNPSLVLSEMKRITKPGGTVIAFAEPDYTGRIDYPNELEALGIFQNNALRDQGIDLQIGRKLPALFSTAELNNVQFGLSGFQSTCGDLPNWFDSEWLMIQHDLADNTDFKQLNTLKEIDRESWQNGSRVLWIPTFYAFGKV